jgi:hypothetical protein
LNEFLITTVFFPVDGGRLICCFFYIKSLHNFTPYARIVEKMENHNHHIEHQEIMSESADQMSHIHDNKIMRMTFSSLFDYRVTLLIDSWEIVSAFQYLIAWTVVVLLVVVHHFLRYSLLQLELEMQDSSKLFSTASLSSHCFLTSVSYGVSYFSIFSIFHLMLILFSI